MPWPPDDPAGPNITATLFAGLVCSTSATEDFDGDGVDDFIDNCVDVANGPLLPDAGGNIQRDTDLDGYGNVCDADLNNLDGLTTVNLSDYSAFRSVFGDPAPGPPFTMADHADFNGNGTVNLSDYSLFRRSFGGAPGPSGLNPLP